MKKILYLFVVLSFLLISCNPHKNKIKGIWIGAYQIHYFGDTMFKSSMRLLLDISENELIYKTFDYHAYEEKDTLVKVGYSIHGNRLIAGSDTFLIKNLTEDSLTLTFNSEYRREFVFKRLVECDENLEVNLTNNAFVMITSSQIDSIDFINDSLMMNINQETTCENQPLNWTISTYKSFQFLVLDYVETPPLLISQSFRNKITLNQFFTSNKKIILLRIQNSRDTSGLIGDWINDDLLPPPPNYPHDEDVRLRIKIRSDSIIIKKFGKVKSRKWKLNTTKDFIYFPDDINSRQGVWQIIHLANDTLIIKKQNLWDVKEEIIWLTRNNL